MTITERLEYLRSQIHAECISQGEIAELQSLAEHIEPGDVELLQWAEFPEEDTGMTVGQLREYLTAFPDDAYVSVVYRDARNVVEVATLTGFADGSAAQDMSHVYLYGESF